MKTRQPKQNICRALVCGFILICISVLFCGCDTEEDNRLMLGTLLGGAYPGNAGAQFVGSALVANANSRSQGVANDQANNNETTVTPSPTSNNANQTQSRQLYFGDGTPMNNANRATPSLPQDGAIQEISNQRLADGSIYTGMEKFSINDGLWHPEGTGKRTMPDGTTFEGEWERNKFNGKVSNVKITDGSIYTGMEKGENNLYPYGIGKKTMPDGSTLEGEWDQGKFVNGKASNDKMTDGSIYTGMEKLLPDDGLVHPDGIGKKTMPDGSTLEGEWDQGKFVNGKASNNKMTDGSIYTGMEKLLPDDGLVHPDGHGIATMPDGSVFDGEWVEGHFTKGKKTLADGKTFFIGTQTQASETSQSLNSDNNLKNGIVNVSADDATFEVYSDGAFVGNSPAKLKLSEGTHVIEVKKAGFKDYKKEITVLDSSELNLKATLQKE